MGSGGRRGKDRERFQERRCDDEAEISEESASLTPDILQNKILAATDVYESGVSLGEKLGEILDKKFKAFSCFSQQPAKISPQAPPNL